jgi:hypothetical protein
MMYNLFINSSQIALNIHHTNTTQMIVSLGLSKIGLSAKIICIIILFL